MKYICILFHAFFVIFNIRSEQPRKRLKQFYSLMSKFGNVVFQESTSYYFNKASYLLFLCASNAMYRSRRYTNQLVHIGGEGAGMQLL